MRIAILLYDGMTALDAIGPYDVLRQVPGAEVLFVGDGAGVKRTEEQPLGLVADRTLAEVPHADILVAGVSAGIDMALRLVARVAGDDMARGIQLGIEYDPAPPFDAGSPRKAPEHVVQLVRQAVEFKRERYRSSAA